MLEELKDEIDVLSSIYAENVIVQLGSSGECHQITYRDPEGAYAVTFSVPLDYPAQSRPSVDLDFKFRIGESRKCVLLAELNELIDSMFGEVVLFASVERLKELVADPAAGEIQDVVEIEHNEHEIHINNRAQTVSAVQVNITVIHGPVSVEQKSSFQSHFAVVRSMQDVDEFKQSVLSDKRIARATHNIFAYRFTCPNGTGVVYHDCDDDGETAAAGRVAEMLRLMGVDGVAVIITRWFGGVLLGPDRFKFICNSARNLLEDHGYGKTKKK